MSLKIASLAVGVVVAATSLSLWLVVAARDTPPTAPPPPPRVGVVTLKNEPIPLTSELPGRVAAFRNAEVRPQVGGIVQKRLFTEGEQVKAQQPLYQIDPGLFQAEYDRGNAALARARAQLRTAALLIQRYRPLAESRAISRQVYDDAVAAHQQAVADVQSAEAQLETARINLVYTRVLSPIDGIIGRSLVTEGALVTAQQAEAVAAVQQIDPIYVDVTQSSVQLLRLRNALESGAVAQADGPQSAAVTLTLEDGSRYAHGGKLQFSEITVDRSTGSVVLRAVFPNPERKLLPGMFVRARLLEGMAAQGGLLVPQRGITRNPRGEATALVVNEAGKVELRELTTERAMGDSWLVSTGLAAGDRVIVEGVQQVRPGAQVNAVEWAPAATTLLSSTRKEPAHG
ncbi:efflux RND transporter periplasmic adaptor subunit [Serratia liquefaciens]|uniref:efflux RND transporter periplasmic adaptor subunit n=1 Tax=Serratia liquefaciens TaxID=614 RepID=UPI00101E8A01|nr:efflux RND transporter periplasmic adaptor subunit [Serratia liquefaciens]MBI6162869.1 efflux RND transporter periplasmic adaptor subunit [Serratia liquefaciens]RYM78000.1 efflux transporter periplasmic adaptor subunit [Serratia liquefaciens]RYM78899.1 efflux transporter periplasmic adaptor subunit [Serratia liquefaciens]HEJ7888395.1 efflux RND transporter periplasmic adaptor subunit [Serratia liquefaciens]HEJ8089315.1 efflux RND transporter periplasmic adaptor subunit [Serratia liquefacien